jgi:Crp-like helix-turn-helix domain
MCIPQGAGRACFRRIFFPEGDSDVVQLTQEFLSEMLGVQRTTVTVIARELQALGHINCRRGKIEITHRRGLEQKACGCYDFARRKIDSVYADSAR